MNFTLAAAVPKLQIKRPESEGPFAALEYEFIKWAIVGWIQKFSDGN